MSVAAGNKNHLIRLIAVVLTGILAGLSGMVLALILHAIQHLAFGYSYGQIVGSVSFLQGVTESSWPRRIVAIVAGGAVAGFGWWLLGRYGQRRVSIAAAVANPCVPMPAGTTTIHALLQIVTVALGSPLGREVAPREMGALGAGMVARKLRLLEDETRTLIACGAGAGLAGPILGTGAWLFRKATSAARSRARSNWQMPVFCLLGFSLLAILSLYFPELPGNGKGPMQLALSDGLPLSMVAVLLVLKMVVILAVLRGGAEGGLLTPGLAVGGLVSLLLCALWQLGFPGGDKSSFAVVGAAAFLAASMQMPLTAVALVMEFTHMDHSYLAPALLCAAGAFLTCRALDKK
ncbi:TPA: chloride channel protein [Klebsiella pneumoniae]